MRIALIAHDKNKEEMIQFAKKNESILKKVDLSKKSIVVAHK